MVGFGAPRRTGRLPPFVLVALLVVIALLAFNYWSVSSRQGALLEDLSALQEQVQRTEVARSRLEKRHSDLMVQAESGRRQLEQRLGEYQNVEERLQARDLEAQRCEVDREKLLANASQQMADISRLKEQLNELRQEVLRQEDQLHEYKNNYTSLQKALKEESQQCTKRLEDQKREYEESIKKLQLASKDKVEKELSKNQLAGGEEKSENKVNAADTDVKDVNEEDPGNRVHYDKGKLFGLWRLLRLLPEIEDSEPAKPNLVPTVVKKVEIVALPQEVGESEKQPSLQPDSITNAHVIYLPPGVNKEPDSPLEDNALRLGQLPGKPLPKEPKSMIFPNLKQSRFFDENESPVDPQHGSKVADYNGDDGNVGEYEADKQAELAYNEEEDGDGGEEDVQEDDENDGQGDAAEYRKDHFGETL
ncbi:PREDICTED: protein CASC4 [Nanorana parkeri]|uniref:protein CASC4 n=1 Tax=Nanorana parkeri TaxID=125878 RepID=UPI000854BC9A|nr:PREDICTED: protein CASC4 [Nanorana parkeri]